MRVKNLILGIGIFIVYLLVLNYGIEAFYPSPVYEDICTSRSYYYAEPMKITNNATCNINPTPQEQDQCVRDGGNIVADTYDSNGCPLTYKCDFCQKEFNDAQKSHSQIVFIISIIAGILTLLVGYTILSVEPVGSALMASGVGALVYGSIRNWQNLSNIWKFLLLLAALILLVWIALRINRQEKKGFWISLGIGKR